MARIYQIYYFFLPLMKISIPQVMLMILCMGVAYANKAEGQNVLERKISLSVNNEELKTALIRIENASNVRFVYNHREIKTDRKISLNVKDEQLKEVLTNLLEPLKIRFEVNGDHIVLQNQALGLLKSNMQLRTFDRPVKGRVLDEKNEPVIGATVVLKGTTRATMTDVEGNFVLHVEDEKSVLVISFIGYNTKEVTVGSQTELSVILSAETQALDEVVVVGYGTQKKVNLTGAVSTISGEAFENRPVTQLTQALQGSVPNLNITFGSGQPGSSGTLNVRGSTSINGGGPLVLIDGVLGELDRINANDVESVTVLKDASAAAVYGARGAFGVILVTTKSAKKDGVSDITYSNNFGFTTHPVRTDYITSGYWNAKINDDAMRNTLGYGATLYSEEDYAELWARVNDKTENPDRPWVVIKKNAAGRDLYRYYGNFDWFNYFYNKWRPKQDHNLSFSGRSGKTTYAFSGATAKEQGIFNINPDMFTRHNLRTKVESKLKKWLTVSNNMHFYKSSYDWYGFASNFSLDPRNAAGVRAINNAPIYHYHPMYVPRNPDGTLTGYGGISNYPVGIGLHNALESGSMKGYKRGTELTNTTQMLFRLAKGFTLTGNYTFREFRSDDSYRQTKQYYSKYPGVLELSSLPDLSIDRLSESMSKYQWNLINIFGNYETSFGYHNLSGMLGFNQENQTSKRVGGNGQELHSETLNDLSLVTGERQFVGGAEEWAVRGGFFRVNYDYAGKYLMEVSGRYDGTSRFPKNSRFGFFPSFSAGWRLSEEEFFRPLKSTVNNLKLRYSYGSLGNQDVSTYAYISAMSTGQINYLSDNQRLNATNDPAPIGTDLTWESITTSNFGLDIGLFKNRLNIETDFYIRDTRGMLTKGRTLAAVFGAPEPRENAADLRTKGFDLSVNWQDEFLLAKKPFSWGVRGILSDYTARITRFDNPAGLLTTYYKGQKLGEIWGYRYDGLFRTNEDAQAWAAVVNQDFINTRRTGAPTAELRKLQAGDIKILDLNGDGVINNGLNTLSDPGDRRIIGNTTPRYSFGLTFNASWNGFYASVFFQGVGHRDWYPDAEAQSFWSVYSRPYDSFIPADFPDKIWSPENPDAYFPLLRGYIAQSSELLQANDMYLQDLAYIKVRNLTVGYTLPERWTKRVKVSRARIFATGENLRTWTKLKSEYLDPEQLMIDNSGRSYPIGRVWSFGTQISF